jgi:HSP20 family protein
MWSQLHGELNELWGSTHPNLSEAPMNLWAKPDEAFVSIELPGRKLEDIHVSVHRDVLTIELENNAAVTPENATPVRVERNGSALTRQVRLPFEVDTDRVDATYEMGLLRIRLHRHQSTMPTKVTVSAA